MRKYHPVQLPSLVMLLRQKLQAPVELLRKNLLRSRKVAAAQMSFSRAKLRWRGCAVNRNAVGQATNDTSPRTFSHL